MITVLGQDTELILAHLSYSRIYIYLEQNPTCARENPRGFFCKGGQQRNCWQIHNPNKPLGMIEFFVKKNVLYV